MSYCRWSSNNFRCDVYVYESVLGGWTTHVAGRRHLLPAIPDLLTGSLSRRLFAWAGGQWDTTTRSMRYASPWRAAVAHTWSRLAALWHTHVHLKSLRLTPLRRIGLPHDGETFSHATPAECADWLEQLRALGYVVPQHAIDALRAEAAGAPDDIEGRRGEQ